MRFRAASLRLHRSVGHDVYHPGSSGCRRGVVHGHRRGGAPWAQGVVEPVGHRRECASRNRGAHFANRPAGGNCGGSRNRTCSRARGRTRGGSRADVCNRVYCWNRTCSRRLADACSRANGRSRACCRARTRSRSAIRIRGQTSARQEEAVHVRRPAPLCTPVAQTHRVGAHRQLLHVLHGVYSGTL